MAICSLFPFNAGGGEGEDRAKPLPGSTPPYKAGVTLPRGLTGPSGNKLRGCPELYRKLLLTAENHTGLPYLYKAPAAQPAADTAGRPIKDPARAPASFCEKNVLILSARPDGAMSPALLSLLVKEGEGQR